MTKATEVQKADEVEAQKSDPAAALLGGGKKAKEAADEPKMTLGVSELQQIIASAVAAATGQANTAMEKLAQAFLDSRKPYVDPRKEENDASMRKQMQETQKRIREEIEASREGCPHMQGSNALSRFQGPLTAFVFHQVDTGELVGICTNCQKIIRSTNPGDLPWFKKKSANVPSQAGQRVFRDPMKVQMAGRLVNDDGTTATGL